MASSPPNLHVHLEQRSIGVMCYCGVSAYVSDLLAAMSWMGDEARRHGAGAHISFVVEIIVDSETAAEYTLNYQI